MATTRSRKALKINRKLASRVKATAVVIVLLAIGAARWPVPTVTFILGILAVLAYGYRTRPRQLARQSQPQAKADPDRKARERGWVQPLKSNLVAVSRQCASGQHILCTATECECDDCFYHDEEKIMRRNREEYDNKYPDEPPFLSGPDARPDGKSIRAAYVVRRYTLRPARLSLPMMFLSA